MGLLIRRLIGSLNVKFFSKSSNVDMKYLNVAEKNDAAKNIASLLSRGTSTRREGYSCYNKIYEFDATVFGHPARMVMTSVSGHLLNYEFTAAFKGWQSCSPLALFNAPLMKTCPPDYENIKKTLEREIRSCGGLIIWTDCDREGENIGFEIIKVCTDVKPNIPVYRAKFSEITGTSVFRALNTLGQPNKNVSDAVEVRQELDLRTGAAFTRLQTLRFQKVFPQKLADKLISYGSCQFPTLGFVVERYQAIESFIPEPFWRIKMNHRIKDLTVDFNWKRDRLFNKNACEALLDICKENPLATVEQVESKAKSKWRPLPLDTVELEKTVSRKLRINAKDTMKAAEKLYTQGFISYPRTETNIFPKELDLAPLVEQQCEDHRWGPFARGILDSGGPNPRQGRKSDQAHPPIHPTKYTNNLTGNEQRIYEYIVRHFLACVSKDALGHETVVHVDIANEKFLAKGLFILERNYLEVYVYDKWNAKEIHEYQEGDTFTPTELSLAEGSTSAPKLLTEADLIALMERHGIGTDATHAEHIETIKSREYVGLHENIYFVPGTLGMGLVEGYNNIGLEVSLAKPTLRANFENDLKLICEGRKDAETVRLEQIEKYRAVFEIVMEKIRYIDQTLSQRLEDRPQEVQEVQGQEDFKPVLKCPKCGNDMVIRSRKTGAGKYISCVGFPACRNAVWLPLCIDTIEVLDENCGNCGPNVKKVKVKFKQNPFPGEPNPNVICLGGCDNIVLETFDINPSLVRRVNAPPPNNTNPIVVPNQRTLNNWINAGAEEHNQNQRRNTAGLPATRPNFSNNSARFGTQASSRPTNDNWRGGGSSSRPTNDNWRGGESSSRPTNDSWRGGDSSSRPTNDNRRGGGSNPDNKWSSRSFLNSNASQVSNTNGTHMLPMPNRQRGNNNFNNNRPSGNFGGGGGSEDTLCSCNKPAILLTVRKEGPNTGRQFYKCQLDSQTNGGCGFFLWADAPGASRFNSTSGTSTFNSTSGTNMNATRRVSASVLVCNCNLPAAQRRVNKEGPNKDREFFCCPKPIGEGCKFFKWADEVDNNTFHGGDDDDDDDDPGGGPSQGWSGGNTSRWQGGSGSPWKKKSARWKGKGRGKKKTKTMPFKAKAKASQSSSTKQSSARKCSKCAQPGHTKNKCPN